MPDWEVGTRLMRDGRTFEVVRITPAGAAGTSHRDGPTYHARIVQHDGTTDPRGYVVDIWAHSTSAPTSAYTEVHERDSGEETVTTWANGFGTWHCRVDFPAPGYGPQYLDGHIDRIRAKARRAIRREILLRSPAGFVLAPVRVEVADSNLDAMNRMRSITYAERT